MDKRLRWLLETCDSLTATCSPTVDQVRDYTERYYELEPQDKEWFAIRGRQARDLLTWVAQGYITVEMDDAGNWIFVKASHPSFEGKLDFSYVGYRVAAPTSSFRALVVDFAEFADAWKEDFPQMRELCMEADTIMTSDDAMWLAYERAPELLNEIAPLGTSFGSHPGGGCQGFWPEEVYDE